MKIDSDHPFQHTAPKRNDHPAHDGKTSAFANILGQKVDQQNGMKVQRPVTAQPLLRPTLKGSVHPAYGQTDRMLDALERYHRLLSDPRASLRTVEPAVRQIKSERVSLEIMATEMPADHPLKPIVSETLTVVAEEIARFEGGDYVQD